MAQQPGVQVQPTCRHGTAIRTDDASTIAQGQNQLQRAMAEAYAQQTAIARNIATIVEVRDRSEPQSLTSSVDRLVPGNMVLEVQDLVRDKSQERRKVHSAA